MSKEHLRYWVVVLIDKETGEEFETHNRVEKEMINTFLNSYSEDFDFCVRALTKEEYEEDED